MIRALEKGKTLIVDGPASIKLLSGSTSVLGALFGYEEKVVVRKGKRLPFEALQDSQIELTLGDSASCTEIDENTIHPSWKESVDKILSIKEPKGILVIGGPDSGKTSFCIYLINRAVGARLKVTLIDGDLGQTSIGPPGTVGLALIQDPVVDLFNLQPEAVFFVGTTSPSKATGATIRALKWLKNKSLKFDTDILVVNTDGWIEGDIAANYKVELAKSLDPDIIVGINRNEELNQILSALNDKQILIIASSKMVKKRDKETRKALRESAYRKFLKGEKTRKCPLSRVQIGGSKSTSPEGGMDLMAKTENLVGNGILYSKETHNCIFLVVRKGKRLENSAIRKFELKSCKRIVMLQEGDEQGLMVALTDANKEFLGIGIIDHIDYKKEVMYVSTAADETFSEIHLGQIRLDREGNEVELSQLAAL